MPGPLLAADAPALLYRAFFGLPDSIKGADGEPIHAVLGATNMLLQVVEERAPRAVAPCFGQEDAAYRKAMYAGYHAKRPPMPGNLPTQFEQAARLWSALGWRPFTHDALEADDLLGSLAKLEHGPVLILTGDRDMFQCASERVTILLQSGRARGGPEAVDPAGVRERYGIGPEQVPDFIALRGDPSDGIPGAKGIGAKGAADLLRRHGTLEAAIAGAIRETPSVRRALLEQGDELLLFKHLATLQDAGVNRPPDGAPFAWAAGAAVAAELGMGRLAGRMEALA